MDRLKGVAKGGWKPSGDRTIIAHRDTWKSDLKGFATGKKNDPNERAREHTSTPLTTLRDPDSFGAPPKHQGVYGSSSNVSSPSYIEPQGGLGSPVPTPSRRQQQVEPEEEEVKAPAQPYSRDTTGLQTNHLPKPPARRGDTGGINSPARTSSPSLPPRQTPSLPSRQITKPPPSLPPRMNENPSDWTPPPPPTYGEATQSSIHDPAVITQGAATRLSQAGVSVPGFGIGSTTAPSPQPQAPRGTQLSELQQRFSRMNTAGLPASPSGSSAAAVVSAVAKKPAPPPPPPKRGGLVDGASRPASCAGGASMVPPPVPLGSKPRPTG
ncbi:hypothetical protein LTR62_008014 [Meristemomyces frigidus]|uniref:Uncharacterized protein n=1 Tax=Meristemomyces frigidus TaxID=1508187 RepID=A0AAN7TPV4_9PEZI|nr:hypothetical protein LTR62_008014 [Meristemomyces frigidus]